MQYRYASLSALLASASLVAADSWGPAFSLGPAKAEIISTTSTIYPGTPIPNQPAALYAWIGISNGTGDLIQSIIGSYPPGGSECTGDQSKSWCISSEVFGADGQTGGALTTADYDYAEGIVINYTLADASTYLWTQTMTNAKTGVLLSSFNKTSGPMLGWGTALECNDFNGVPCAGTISPQTYANTTITLKSADSTFSNTMGPGAGVTHSDMVTADGGKTWTIKEIVIPAMQSGVSVSDTATSTSADATTSTPVVAAHQVKTSATSSDAPLATDAEKPSFTAPSSVIRPTSGAARGSAGFGSRGGSVPTGLSFSGFAHPSGTAKGTKSKHHGHSGTHSGHAKATGGLTKTTGGFAKPTSGFAKPAGKYVY